jgi:aminoglycoside 6'-N-acetyltransferase I
VAVRGVRGLEADDRTEQVRMRSALWPDADVAELDAEFDQMLADPNQVVFVAERHAGGLCGMVEAGVRPFANGLEGQPCAFVEGWWVDPDMRRTGIGGTLIAAVEDWARARGFDELGSDVEVPNLLGQKAHTALGFEERERVVYYRKKL